MVSETGFRSYILEVGAVFTSLLGLFYHTTLLESVKTLDYR